MSRWLGAALAAGLVLAGCAGQQGAGPRGPLLGKLEQHGARGDGSPQLGESEVRYGRIARIDPVSLEGEHQLGVGHVLGAVGGGVIGHQFGNGRGRVVAQVVGSLAGGGAGGALQKKFEPPQPGEHITVTLANGVAVGITQPTSPGLAVGDCVRIDGTGPSARVARADCVSATAAPAETSLREQLRTRALAQRPAALRIAAEPAPARPLGESPVRYGRIVGIDSVPIEAAHQFGFDGAMNGASGAALGVPVPGGDARAFAAVADQLGRGGDGPAPAGLDAVREGQNVTVRLDNGVTIGITQPTDAELRLGDRVRIEGSGPSARVRRA
jgi:outer membrane lipoprotein SlyB